MARPSFLLTTILASTLAALGAAGCGSPHVDPGPDGGDGASNSDASVDAASDARPDATREGGNDDAGADGANDASFTDVARDAARDGNSADGARDAASDGPPRDAAIMSIGDTCALATPLPVPGALTGQGLAGLAADYDVPAASNGCMHANGVDGVYEVTVPASSILNVHVAPDGLLDAVLNFVAGPANHCDTRPLICAASADDNQLGGVEDGQFVNNSASPKTVYVIVASYYPGSDTAFSITTSLSDLPSGETCGNAVDLAPGTLPTETIAGYTRDVENSAGATNCQYSSGADRVYSVTVPAGKRLTATVTGSGTIDPVLNLIQGPAGKCDAPVTCLARADSSGTGGTEIVQYTNSSAADATVYLVVSAYSLSSAGTFSVTADIVTPPDGDICATAAPLAQTGSLTGQNLTGFARDYDLSSGTNCRYSSGADRVYEVTVPAGQRLTATATPSGTFDPVLAVIAGPAAVCDASPVVCAASANNTFTGAPETVNYLNSGTGDASVYLVVASDDAAPADTAFALDTSIDVPLPGDTCVAPIVIATPGTLANQDLAGLTQDYSNIANGSNCRYYSDADAVYAITVPAGQQLTTTVDPSAGLDAVIDIVAGAASDCSAPVAMCGAGVNGAGDGGSERAVYTNRSADDETVYIIVGGLDYGVGTTTTFSITTDIAPPPPGDTCAAAQAITAPTMLADEDLAAFNHDYDFNATGMCRYFGGNEKVYSVVVPAGRQLDVTVMESSGLDSVIELVAGPDPLACDASPAVCLAGADAHGSGGGETASFTNSGSAAQTVFVIVGAYSSFASTTTYALDVTVN